jgi:trehalose 6-phosphate phosphatase
MSGMPHLFTPEGEKALAAVMARHPLLAFDFDGTLAPIVERPGDARVPDGAAGTLTALALKLPVAVITGRAVADVTARLGFAPMFVIGNHGAEDPSGVLEGGTLEKLTPLRHHLATHAVDLEKAGVMVEDKQYSLALHYRQAPDQDAAVALIDQLLPGASDGLHIFYGKCVVNLAPDDAPDKGDAVVALLERAGATTAVFLGDDRNDEPVFERAAADWLTVRIGRDNTPTKAKFYLDGHHEVPGLLQRMLGALGNK